MSVAIGKFKLSRRVVQIGAALLAVVLLAGAARVVWGPKENTVTVDFDRTVSLYEGSMVRVLGVNVGKVAKITPRGKTVRVKIVWDDEYKIPADVRAVVVSPSVVGDRFVQLAPAYTTGPKLKDGAHLDASRTGVPTELDETFAALDQVARTLGPEGVNKDGTLSKVLASSAKNLDGKGAEIRTSIEEFAKLSETADRSKDDMFASVEKIEKFVSALETNDQSVREFNSSLAGVSDVLADEGDDLQVAVRELAGALAQIQTYVAENRTGIRRNVEGLADVTSSLAKQRSQLAKILKDGPTALGNLATAYNPTTGTLDTRGSLKGSKSGKFSVLTDPYQVGGYCSAASAQNPDYEEACYAVADVLAQLAAQAETVGKAKAGAVAPASAPDSLASMMGVA
ncbi:MAG TPA: MCE family protein [Aeromicrobium sp.]|nr:MCE family protein [Aeromicrobium sp.]